MGIPRNEVSMKANLTNDYCFDSYDMNIFLFLLESNFNININDKELPQLQTVGTTVNFIEEKLDRV
jgi:acyl carrier protein